jgi:RNA polymerase sigma-70 factor (ECF subfamily)
MDTQCRPGADLIARARAGDMACFERLVEPLYDGAYRLAAAMLDDRSAAEDAVQDALLLAWRKLRRFREGDDLRPWLMTLVANRCRDLRRRRWWSVLRLATVPERATADEMAHVVVDTDLRRALASLPFAERLVLVLRYYLDLPFDDVARIAHVSGPAARKRAQRGLTRLRSMLGEEE